MIVSRCLRQLDYGILRVGIFGFPHGEIQKFQPLKIPLRGGEAAEHHLKKFNLQRAYISVYSKNSRTADREL